VGHLSVCPGWCWSISFYVEVYGCVGCKGVMHVGIVQWGGVGCRDGGPILFGSVTQVCYGGAWHGGILSMAHVGCCVGDL